MQENDEMSKEMVATASSGDEEECKYRDDFWAWIFRGIAIGVGLTLWSAVVAVLMALVGAGVLAALLELARR